MSGDKRIVFVISKKAMKLVKAGIAEISSGGVRDIETKQMVEMAVPAVMNGAVGTLTSVASLVLGSINNIQTAVIQKNVKKIDKKVDKANQKLDNIDHKLDEANQKLDSIDQKVDLSLDKMDQLQGNMCELLQMGTKLEAIEWLNCSIGIAGCAIGIINCAISVATFVALQNHLTSIEKRIVSLETSVDQAVKNAMIQNFHKYSNYIITDLGYLNSNHLDNGILYTIQKDMDETEAYLKDMISQFVSGTIDSHLGLDIIFPLASAYAKELNAVSSVYYRINGTPIPNYDRFFGVVESITEKPFVDSFKKKLFLDYPQLSAEERYWVYNSAMLTIGTQAGEIVHTENIIHKLEQKDYIRLDDILQEKILKNEYEEIGERIGITI